ncbi:DUF4198 domain-containing protein, partial [Novosphingobium sp. 1949]
MRIRPLLIASAALCVALAAPASAHRLWLLPSTSTLSGTAQWVSVDAAVSNDLFYPDHFPLKTDEIKVWQPDGSEGALKNPATGRYRSTFDVPIDKAGTWKIGLSRESIGGTFTLNGETWRVGAMRGGPPGGPGGAP